MDKATQTEVFEGKAGAKVSEVKVPVVYDPEVCGGPSKGHPCRLPFTGVDKKRNPVQTLWCNSGWKCLECHRQNNGFHFRNHHCYRRAVNNHVRKG